MDLLNKIINEYLFIAAVTIIGLIVTVEDFKIDKIRNKWIKWGLVICICLYLVQIIYLVFTHQVIELQNYWQIILNTLVAFILGFLLWNFKLWSGGDAKLFTLFIFFIPISYYQNWYWKYWPGLTLLVNITLPIFIYLIIKFLIYPIRLGINYIIKPALLKKYYQDYKAQKNTNKKKPTEYLAAGLSFIVILIIFQVLRSRLGDILSPYLGKLIIIFYFFTGFVIFQPLRKLLKKFLYVALVIIVAYFIFGYIYFRNLVYNDLHQILALQFIFMISYLYIFRYGKSLIMFLYNSAEIKMIPLANLSSGVYINKDYIKKILNTTIDLEKFKSSLDNLEKEEKEELWNLIKRKSVFGDNDRKQYQVLSAFRYLRLETLPYLFKEIYQYRKQKKVDDKLLSNIQIKLTEEQKSELDNILTKTNSLQKFLKTIRGKLTDEQAQKIKEMVSGQNKKVQSLGLAPIEKIVLHKTFSFAPFMLLGVLITVITKNSVIFLIYEFILQKQLFIRLYFWFLIKIFN